MSTYSTRKTNNRTSQEARTQRNEGMGFFSSRKVEGNEHHLTTTGITSGSATASNDKSVVHVIRSRFYGKNKGKERGEQLQTSSFTTHGATVAHTLSISSDATPTKRGATTTPSPLSGRTKSAGPSILRTQHEHLPISPPSGAAHPPMDDVLGPMSVPPSPRSRNQPSVELRSSEAAPAPRKPTDSVTMTLAQRLNELAVANSEGLLDDDEYRLLRQNLFERFASSAIVPTEASVVPVAGPRQRGNGSAEEGRRTARPLSNFQVDLHRSSSVASKSSVASGVASFLRRATSRRRHGSSKDSSDTSSIISSTSKVSNIFRPRLSKRPSNSSVLTASQMQADAISISSRQNGVGSDRTHSDYSQHFPPSVVRSTTSVRRFGTPPSSFPSRTVGSEARYTGFDINDDEHLKTTVEIRQEILSVEAEAKSLMDAFNGLEVTTLARVRRRQGRAPQLSGETGRRSQSDLLSILSPEGRSQRRVVIAETDVASIRSGTSAGTAPSIAKTVYSGRKILRSKGSLNASLSISRPESLHRKNSSSSIGSQRATRSGAVPPVPSLPSSYGHLGMAKSSNASLTRSTGMSVLVEDEQLVGGSTMRIQEDEAQLENEMEEIRRRREEVSGRYEARLEYLRAKLKGAQLHEKLLKK